MKLSDLSLRTRFRIVGWEVIGVGVLVAVLALFTRSTPSSGLGAVGWGWWFLIAGAALVLVGMECVALANRLPLGASLEKQG